jgi:hypothetical protein
MWLFVLRWHPMRTNKSLDKLSMALISSWVSYLQQVAKKNNMAR